MNYLFYASIDHLPKLLTLLLILLIAAFSWASTKPNKLQFHAQVWRYGWIPLMLLTAIVMQTHYFSYPNWSFNGGGIDLLNGPLLSYTWVCWLLSKS